MKKNNKNKFQKLIILSFIVLAEVFGLYALIKETTWGDSLSDGIRDGLNSGVYTPGRYAFDGDTQIINNKIEKETKHIGSL